LHWALVPVGSSLVQGSPSLGQVVGQGSVVEFGSQVSPVSTTPLPHFAGQSESALVMLVLHPVGQQPSPALQAVMGVWLQTTLQGVPPSTSVVQGSLSLGQVVGQGSVVEFGSQVSPVSTTPLPQTGLQSESLVALHPAGQQPSAPIQAVMATWVQATLQVSLPPVIWSVVQALLSLQEVGHEDFGSQVSPLSTTPLPHFGEQLGSVLALHPAGQQPSSAPQAVMVVWLQATLQLALLPVI
jgi:hypothetical protein